MTYNPSPRTVQRVKDHLELMSNSESNLEFETSDCRKLAMWIREAIQFCQIHHESPDFGKYAKLKSKYIIRQKDNKVIAELRDRSAIPVNATMSKLVLDKLTDALSVVGALIQHKPEHVFFPDFNAIEELPIVYRYTSKNDYHIMRNASGITITKQMIGGTEWTPEQ